MSLREPGERILHERVVVGQHHHQGASGLGARKFPAVADRAVRRRSDVAHPWIPELFDDCLCIVVGTIVGHENFEISERLSEGRLNGAPHQVASVVSWNHDAEQRRLGHNVLGLKSKR
jgi:hypothetical protein